MPLRYFLLRFKACTLALIIISCLLTKPASAQQAWTQPKGKYFGQVGFTLYQYTGLLTSDNSVTRLNKRFVSNSIQGYFEYGITDKVMATVIIPFTLAKSTANSNTQPPEITDGSLNALSNVQLGLTYNFYKQNGYVFSAKLNSSLPTATYQSATGLRSGEDALALEPSALFGYSNEKFFTSAELGFGYRTNNYSSQTLAAFQIGKHFGERKRLLIIFNTNLRLSNKNGSYDDKNSKFTASYLNDLTYLAPGIKLGYNLTSRITGWANVRGALPPTQNIGASPQITPGLSFAISYIPN